MGAAERKLAADPCCRVEQTVVPLRAEAHELPFAEGFFDVVVSLGAYHYFGTDDLYLGDHLVRLVGPGGMLGIVVPGLMKEFDGGATRASRLPLEGWL